MYKALVGSIVGILFLLTFAVMSPAAMWVGPEIGLSFNTNMTIGSSVPSGTGYSLKSRTSMTTGLMFGYDFVNYGTGAAAYPDWMQYFGVVFGISYNPMFFTAQALPAVARTENVDGSNLALSFLFTGKVPLLVDKTYPGGRFAPYVGVGPGLVFTNVDLSNIGGRNVSATNVALIAEAGLTYKVTPEFSASIAYRYRYATPSMNITLPGAGNAQLYGDNHTHQVVTKLSYHF